MPLRKERGAASVAIAILVLLMMAAALATSFSMSGAVVRDAATTTQQAQALFLTESGLARALRRWGTYDAAADPAGLYCAGYGTAGTEGPYNLGAGNFTVSYFATDFTGATLSDKKTLCRVRITAIIPGAGVARTVEAILQRSGTGFPPAVNADFNAPAGTCTYPACQPTNWNFNAGAWADLGDQQGGRAVFVGKDASGQGTDVAIGGYAFYPPITRTAPLGSLTVSFDYKNAINGNAEKMKVEYVKLYEMAPGTRVWTSDAFSGKDTGGLWKTGSVNVNLTGNGQVYLAKIEFKLSVVSGNQYKSWLDNLQIGFPNAGVTTDEKAIVVAWREVVQ